MSVPTAPQRLDADQLLRDLTHWVWDDDPDGLTFCGLDGSQLDDTGADADCPMCIAADEAMEERGSAE